jgi:rSAM/selenodomain-associated transferase 1
MRRTLVIFAKAPALGRVKSRLARGIGQAAALAFYRQALRQLVGRVADDRRWHTVLAVAPDSAIHDGRLWSSRVSRTGQGAGDLGDRMARAFRIMPKGAVVIVGADIPEIGADHIASAFRALGDADFVFGPARDGGYWLIGAKGAARAADMFAQVRWSTKHALADTRANLKARRVALIETLDDVDDVAAYRRFLRRGGFTPSPSASP